MQQAQLTGQVNPQFAAQMQPQQEVAPELPKKTSGSRQPFTPERFNKINEANSKSAIALGQSFSNPLRPAEVPAQAPDANDYKRIATIMLKDSATYEAAYKKRLDLMSAQKLASKGQTAKKRNNNGQLVYLCEPFSKMLEASGIFQCEAWTETVMGEDGVERTIEHPAEYLPFPKDELAGGLMVTHRSVVTSAMGALTHALSLKNPEHTRYMHFDHPITEGVITRQILEILRASKPKSQTNPKKKPVDPSKKKKAPRDNGPRVLDLVKMDYATGLPVQPEKVVPHVNFDAITALQGYFFLGVPPRGISQEMLDQLAKASAHLKRCTVQRGILTKALDKKKREAAKAKTISKSLMPTAGVQTMTLNPNFQLPNAGAQGIAGFVPQPTPAFTAPPPTHNTPAGFAPQPGVTFVPN